MESGKDIHQANEPNMHWFYSLKSGLGMIWDELQQHLMVLVMLSISIKNKIWLTIDQLNQTSSILIWSSFL